MLIIAPRSDSEVCPQCLCVGGAARSSLRGSCLITDRHWLMRSCCRSASCPLTTPPPPFLHPPSCAFICTFYLLPLFPPFLLLSMLYDKLSTPSFLLLHSLTFHTSWRVRLLSPPHYLLSLWFPLCSAHFYSFFLLFCYFSPPNPPVKSIMHLLLYPEPPHLSLAPPSFSSAPFLSLWPCRASLW